MSYVILETELARYRVILGMHTKPSGTQQLSENCGAILCEGNLTERDQIANFTDPDYAPRQLSGIIPYAKENGLPIVALEPLWVKEEAKRLNQHPPRGILLSSLALPAIAYLAFNEGEVGKNNLLFRWVDRVSKMVGLTGEGMRVWGPLKNLLMAHRAERFAVRSGKGASKPELAIVGGMMHTGLVEALEMDPQERLSSIKEDLLVPKYFQTKHLEEVFFVRYNPRINRWNASSI